MTQPETSPSNTTIDTKFYFELITIEVENCLFRVPKRYLESECQLFKDIFSLPATENGAEGSSDSNPFRIEGVLKSDFRAFLEVLLQRHREEIQLEESQWIAVLELALKWDSPKICEQAISTLEPILSPIMKINTGRRMMINRQEWVVDGYMSLIERDTPLTLEEGRQLRVDDIIKIAKWREIKVAIGVWCDMQALEEHTVAPVAVSAFDYPGGSRAPSREPSPYMFMRPPTHPRDVGREVPVTIRPYIRGQAYNREAVKSGVQNDLYPSHDHTTAHQSASL